VTHPVITPCFSLPLLFLLSSGRSWEHPSVETPIDFPLLFRFLFFFTCRVDIVGSNLLVTRPVTSTCSFSLASSSTAAFSCFSSSWKFQRLSRRFVNGRPGIRNDWSSDSPCDFFLLSLFLSRVRYLSFLFRLCLLLLRLCHFFPLPHLFCLTYYADRNYSSSSLSSFSSAKYQSVAPRY
jgi:hypothetical protein